MLKKIFIYFVGLLGFVYCLGEAKQLTGNVELITSRYTELYLVQQEDNQEKVLLNSKYEPVSTLLPKNLSFYQSYQLGNEDVLVFLSEDYTEKCVKFVIIGVSKHEVTFTPTFGNCLDSPEIIQNTNDIEIRFPMTSNVISQTVVYKNQKIEITETRVSKK